MQGWERCTPAQSRCSARPSRSGIPDPGQRRFQCRNPVKQSAAVLDILKELFKGVVFFGVTPSGWTVGTQIPSSCLQGEFCLEDIW